MMRALRAFTSGCGFKWAFCVVVVAGCGGPDLGTPVDVSGTITMDGVPLPNVQVIYYNSDSKGVPPQYRQFVATTDSSGSYEISGVYPGTYIVSVKEPVAESEIVDPNSGDVELAANEDPGPLAKYGGNSELRAEVTEKKTTFDFPLNSQQAGGAVPGAQDMEAGEPPRA